MQIRTLQKNELALVFKHSALEGWSNESIHTTALYHAHEDDFFIAYKEEQLVGFIIAIKYSNKFGFISNLLVLRKFRKLGYGKKIFDYALKHLDGCQIALDSVVGKENLYKKHGFKSYFDVLTYKLTNTSISLAQTHFNIIDFDKNLSLKGKDTYMSEMILSTHTIYKAIKHKESISSFALAFEYLNGYKLHIESEDINEALALFFALKNVHEKNMTIYLQTSPLSPMLEAIAEALKMQVASKFIRMYNFITKE